MIQFPNPSPKKSMNLAPKKINTIIHSYKKYLIDYVHLITTRFMIAHHPPSSPKNTCSQKLSFIHLTPEKSIS